MLPGEDEARLTFLAVRRWFGWSSGRLAVFDIGGGSLEVAGGDDETPDVAWSLPLGAGRLTRDIRRRAARATRRCASCAARSAPTIAHDAGTLLRGGAPDHAVATSKTFRSLARICGAAPSSEGPFVRRMLPRRDLVEWIPKLLDDGPPTTIAELPGVSATAPTRWSPAPWWPTAVMDIFDLEELEICPWALREGVILDRLDQLSALG